MEKETQDMEETKETPKLVQAQCTEQEKVNKKLTEQTDSYLNDIIKLTEELHSCKAKVCCVPYWY